MNTETSEFWDDVKEGQRKRRDKRLPVRTKNLLELQKEGFKVEEKTMYHFRVNDCLDIWPTHNRFHDLKRNKRGGYPEVTEFVRNFFAHN